MKLSLFVIELLSLLISSGETLISKDGRVRSSGVMEFVIALTFESSRMCSEGTIFFLLWLFANKSYWVTSIEALAASKFAS